LQEVVKKFKLQAQALGQQKEQCKQLQEKLSSQQQQQQQDEERAGGASSEEAEEMKT
jgi:hypothetical protein